MGFYDAHAHTVEEQKGGFVIALEGEPYLSRAFGNRDIHQICSDPGFIPVEYVRRDFNPTVTEVIKYHPKRECYSKEDIISDLRCRNARVVIVDTLNSPYYNYLDYWEIVSSFKDITFVLAHCGGYDIDDFIKVVDFNKNVYADFSYTQEYMGVVVPGSNAYAKISDAMDHMLNTKRINRKILFGSDNPFFSQRLAYEYYFDRGYIDLLNENFEELIDKTGISR